MASIVCEHGKPVPAEVVAGWRRQADVYRRTFQLLAALLPDGCALATLNAREASEAYAEAAAMLNTDGERVEYAAFDAIIQRAVDLAADALTASDAAGATR